MAEPLIMLASASPRRSELLRQVGIAHEVRPVHIDEAVLPGEAPSAYVLRLAEAKASALWQSLGPREHQPVLAADTTVALAGEIFGKPADLTEARAMLGRLSGRTHEVHTAIAVQHAALEQGRPRFARTHVDDHFRAHARRPPAVRPSNGASSSQVSKSGRPMIPE
jgi:septum formation protein